VVLAGTFSAHATAIVESDSIGDGTAIWAYSHVLRGASVGRRCNIGDHCYIESGASIGDDVTIKNLTAIWEGVTIENGVFIGPGVTFTNDIYPRSPRMKQAANRYRGREWLAKIVVGEGATLGAGSVVVAGLTIGAHAFVGAGAVVTHNVPSFALVVGNPARVQGWVCACGSRLEFVQPSTICETCGMEFRQTEKGVETA
jgi:UDP-2-acetamido-3-amino-2,3-dideoxy-glucuronate N-acetyltransferase